VKRSLALMYAINPYGADHQSSEHDPSYNPDAYEIPQYMQRANEIGLSNPQADDVLNEAKVEYALVTQYAYSALDTFSVCQFVYGPAWQLLSMGNLAEMVSAVTGWDIDIEEMLQVGARRVNMMRVYNLREGMGRVDDVLPKRLFEEPLISGASDGVSLDTIEFETALDEYYKQAGWDTQNGTPTQETLDNLGLHWLAEL